MKQAIIIHGWGGHPNEAWIPWLKAELEKKGYTVTVPAMPNTEHPVIKEWVSKVKNVLLSPDEETLLVGHSIGCQTILRYLETVDRNVDAIVLVAPWLTLKAYEDDEEKEIARPWETMPIDWEMIKNRIKKTVCLFSDNDDCVDLSQADVFREKLGADIIIEQGKGHFSGDDGITQIPAILERLDR